MEDITGLCRELTLEIPDHYYYKKTFERHLNDLEKLDPDKYKFDNRLAQAYIFFIQELKHFKGAEFAGKNLILEKWQKAMIGILYGWKKKINGKWVRRFNTSLILLARKNAKSTIAAASILADFFITKEPSAEIACFATKTDQAKIVWEMFFYLIQSHKDLKSLWRKSGNTLTYIDGSKIFTLGRNSKTFDGYNISHGIADEIHAMPDNSIIEVVKSSQGSRNNPLMFYISTAGFDLASPLVQELDYAKDILNGSIENENYFAFIAQPELKIGKDVFSLKDEDSIIDILNQANPNIDVSVSSAYLLREFYEAQKRPELRVNFLTKHLNIFTSASEVFLPIEKWKSCALRMNEDNLNKAHRVFIGVDMSVVDDFTAVCTTYMFDDMYYNKWMYFIPKRDLRDRAKRLRVPLETWIDKGYITIIEDSIINEDIIFEYISNLIDKYQDMSPIVSYDPYKMKRIISRLENEIGFKDVVPVPQGFRTMTEPLYNLLHFTSNQMLRHENNPVSNWMVGNIEVVFDSYGNMKIEKSNPNKKIDGIAALLNNLHAMTPYIEESQDVQVIWV